MPGSSASAESARGGGWVAAQLALMGLAIVAAFLPPGWGAAATILVVLGAAVAAAGVLLVAWAWRSLGEAATPFPRPQGGLVVSGPYAFARHPVYTGGIVFFLGLALATTPAVLVPAAALAVLWRYKAAVEEDLLEERHPEYADYRARVSAFLPTPFRRAG